MASCTDSQMPCRLWFECTAPYHTGLQTPALSVALSLGPGCPITRWGGELLHATAACRVLPGGRTGHPREFGQEGCPGQQQLALRSL